MTITGAGFTGATQVTFSGLAAASFVVNSDTRITAVTPAHGPGTGEVMVSTPGGTSPISQGSQFSFAPSPSVTSVTPGSGPASGGTSVTISGSGFTGATGVSFGSVPARSLVVNSDTSITTVAPNEPAGTVDVTVTAPGGTTATGTADRFIAIPRPVVRAVSPASGPASGGTKVTITGSGLTTSPGGGAPVRGAVVAGRGLAGTTQVSFGAVPAASVTTDLDGSITAVSPPEPAGVVDVAVTTAGGTSAASPDDLFSFAGPTAPVPTAPDTGLAPVGHEAPPAPMQARRALAAATNSASRILRCWGDAPGGLQREAD